MNSSARLVAVALLGAVSALAGEETEARKDTNCSSGESSAVAQNVQDTRLPLLRFRVASKELTASIQSVWMESCNGTKSLGSVLVSTGMKLKSESNGTTLITIDPNQFPELSAAWPRATAMIATVVLKNKKELKPIVIKDFKKAALPLLRRSWGSGRV